MQHLNGNTTEAIIRTPPIRRILMIIPYAPNPVRVRTFEGIAQLVQHSEVDILCLDDGSPIKLPDGVRDLKIISNSSKLRRLFRVIYGLARGIPAGYEFYNSMRLPDVLAGIDLSQYDIIYVERLPLHLLGLRHPRIIFDAVDCWSNTTRVMAKHITGYRRILYALDSMLTLRHEVAACNSANIVLVSAEREAAHLRELGVTAMIQIHLHSRQCFAPLRVLQERERLVVSFHGKLSYVANEMALCTLNRDVAVRLDASRFDLRIIGKCPPAFRSKFKNLKFTGYVESISEALQDSDLSVFPLVISVGFPNKAMESLAAGVPFIGTHEVVEGLPPMPELLEQGVYIRELSEFSAEIERFSQLSLTDRQRIAEKCRAYVSALYNSPSQNTQWQQLLGILTGEKVSEADPITSQR
ncbi:MAG: glycosyltransferase [Terracidiphilus sp.]